MPKEFEIAGRKIGEGHPCFIVAEMSGNHKQDIRRAYKLIDAAAEAGVDAVKLQTYTPDTLTINSKQKWFQITGNSLWAGQSLYDLYKTTYTPWGWQPKLKEYGEKKGLIVFSTPFDVTAVDFLEKTNVALYKIASFESIDLELLKRIGKTGKPVILSRGMASINDIKLAIASLRKSGTTALCILHCISAYPATLKQMNIATMQDIKKRFKVIAGLSDHTLGTIASVTAVALGAKVIEKHFTLSRKDGGPDYAFSLEPAELRTLVQTIREVETAIGLISYKSDSREEESIILRRSLFIVKDVKKGELLNKENVRCIRPGNGMHPKYFNKVIGKAAKTNIARGTPLSWKLLS